MLPFPTSNLTLILHTLLNKKNLTERESNQNGFRARISNLRKLGVPLDFIVVKFFKNQFGRKNECRAHFIKSGTRERELAEAIYLKIWRPFPKNRVMLSMTEFEALEDVLCSVA